jgi:hypothetical protein
MIIYLLCAATLILFLLFAGKAIHNKLTLGEDDWDWCYKCQEDHKFFNRDCPYDRSERR